MTWRRLSVCRAGTRAGAWSLYIFEIGHEGVCDLEVSTD